MATNPFHQLDCIRKISREGKRVKDCYRLLYHKSLWIHVYKQLFQCKDNHWNQTKKTKNTIKIRPENIAFSKE